jgi:hypothetical protein
LGVHENEGRSEDLMNKLMKDPYTPRSLVSEAHVEGNALVIRTANQTGGERAVCFAATDLTDSHTSLTKSNNCDPTTYEEAMNSPIPKRWIEATKDEWKSMQTCDLENQGKIPHEIKPIGSRWVYKLKRNIDGFTKLKVCYVIIGFQQTPYIDFAERYTPVSMLSTFRFLLAISTAQN